MSGRLVRSWAAALLVACPSAVVHAQQTVLLPEEIACPECRIRLQQETVLGDFDGPGMLESDTNWLVRGPRGRYYVCSPDAPYFWVFDGGGTILQRIGRQGQGPGEFHAVSRLAVRDDGRVYAFDARQRRLSIFSPEYELLDTANFTLPLASGGAVPVDEGMVVNGLDRITPGDAHPLHLVDASGRIVGSFGNTMGEYDPRQREFYELRSVGAAGDGGVWAAPVNQYLIERWSTAGELTGAIRREVEWFDPWWLIDSGIDLPPDPLIADIFQLGDVLWVLLTLPDPEWHTVVEPYGRFFRVLDRHRYRDSILEAIDLNTHRVIASTRIDRVLRGFVGEGLVYGQLEDPDGDEAVEVLRVEIVRANVAGPRGGS